MLTRLQEEKLSISLKLITEVKADIKDENQVTILGDAITSCDEVIRQNLPQGYERPQVTIVKIEGTPDTVEIILKVLGWIAGTSLLSTALCSCIALSYWGVSEFKSASGWKDGNNYAAETRGFRGLAMTCLGITLMSGVLGNVIGNAYYEKD